MRRESKGYLLRTSLVNLFTPASSGSGNGRLPARHPASRGTTHTPPAAGVETQRQAGRTVFKFKPILGRATLRELTGLWKYKVKRFRLIYEVDRKPGSFGYSRSATGKRFTKNWLSDCAQLDGVNKAAYGNHT